MQTQREGESRQLHTPTGLIFRLQGELKRRNTLNPSHPMEPRTDDMKDGANNKAWGAIDK